MMKNIFKILIPLFFILTGCSKVYHEIWIVEKYPIEWEEEITIEGEHRHYIFDDGLNKCLYYEPDTFCWRHYDTIVVRTLEKTIRVK